MSSGTYEICIDNTMSYTQKKVYLWIDYQRQKDWDEAILSDDAVKKFNLKQDLVRVRKLITAPSLLWVLSRVKYTKKHDKRMDFKFYFKLDNYYFLVLGLFTKVHFSHTKPVAEWRFPILGGKITNSHIITYYMCVN